MSVAGNLATTRAIIKRRQLANPGSSGIGNWTPALPAPHPGQQHVLDNRKRFNVIRCGRRWGKTVMGQRLMVDPALKGKPVAWFAPDYKALTEVWRDTVRLLRPVTARPDAQQHRLELLGGGIIEFWSLDSDPEACRGRKYARIVVDEAAKARHLELAWEQAIRATLGDFRGDAWFLSTPRGKGDFFHALYKRGVEGVRNWAEFYAPSIDNPTIPEWAEELEEIKADTPDAIFRQEYLAEFIDAGGLYFDEWLEEKNGAEWHVCTPFPIPAHWPKWGGLDYGKAAPFAFTLMTSTEGDRGSTEWDTYCIDEEYQERLLPRAQADKVIACLKRNGITDHRTVIIYADPSIFPPSDPKERVGEYPVEAFWAAGLRVVRAGNKRVPGWVQCMEWLHATRFSKGDMVPRFRVFRGKCSNFIRTIPLQIRSKQDPEDLDTTQDDHIMDAWRYSMFSRPRPSAAAPVAPDVPIIGWRKKLAEESGMMDPNKDRV